MVMRRSFVRRELLSSQILPRSVPFDADDAQDGNPRQPRDTGNGQD